MKMDIATVNVRIEGHQPLIFHNSQLANPLNKWAKAMKDVTSKRKKTDADLLELQRLEFMGGIYYDEAVGVYLPGQWFEATIVAAMASVKRGQKKNVRGGLYVDNPKIKLEYDGPRTLEEMWESGQFHRLDIVGVQRNKILRCRPCFQPPWAAEFSMTIIPQVLNVSDVQDALVHASMLEGLGDYRPKFGRYHLVKFDVVKAK